jgi:hypothetical protein
LHYKFQFTYSSWRKISFELFYAEKNPHSLIINYFFQAPTNITIACLSNITIAVVHSNQNTVPQHHSTLLEPSSLPLKYVLQNSNVQVKTFVKNSVTLAAMNSNLLCSAKKPSFISKASPGTSCWGKYPTASQRQPQPATSCYSPSSISWSHQTLPTWLFIPICTLSLHPPGISWSTSTK